MHRVPIIDDGADRSLINLVTQSQFLRFLNANKAVLGKKGSKTLRECQQFFKKIVTVAEKTMVVDAFKVMVDGHITGLAVVNDKGELVGNLSSRDVKCVDAHLRNFWRFFQVRRRWKKRARPPSPPPPPPSCFIFLISFLPFSFLMFIFIFDPPHPL